MELKFALLADTVNASREGKLNIAGEFNTIYAAQLPAVWPCMSIVARLEANVGEGSTHVAMFKLTTEDGKDILVSPPMDVNFAHVGPGIPTRADVVLVVAGLVIPALGDYSVNVFVDGVARGHVTIYVRQPPAVA